MASINFTSEFYRSPKEIKLVEAFTTALEFNLCQSRKIYNMNRFISICLVNEIIFRNIIFSCNQKSLQNIFCNTILN